MMINAVSKYILLWCLSMLTGMAHASTDEYRMGTGDVLRIAVYSQPDLTTEARIDEAGMINFPLVGQVKLGGLTPGAGGAEISKRLKSGKFLIDPHVNLNVTQYRSQQISVLGKVNRPGKFTLEKISRVTDALALAGGASPDGADVITLVRRAPNGVEYREIEIPKLFQKGGESLNVVVSDGDVVNVDRQPVFYIYGEVQRPGIYRLESGVSVVQALSQGGGLTPRGTQKGIKILRRNANGTLQEINTDLGQTVRPDDVIYVKESLF